MDDDSMCTPDEWESAPVEGLHDHKGHSEEKCVRCGWVMGHRPLNCMNDNTPHRFPSQEAEIKRLHAAGDEMADAATRQQWSRLDVAVAAWQETRRG